MIIRLKKLCYGVFLIIVSLLATTGCSSVIDDDKGVTERVRVGDHVPQFTASVVDDTGRHSFSTEQLTGETIIVFFNTWCGDCQRELPLLNDYYLQQSEKSGFQMIAISRAEGEESVAAFWKEKGLQIPYSAQNDRRIYDLFASSIIPRIYFVSPEGVVTHICVEHFTLPQ